MEIFISWSGERSKLIAEMLKLWLKMVIQSLKLWISSKNLDAGKRWENEIYEKLNSSNMGIICLTKENMNAPWILFETGMLLKGSSTDRIFTFLIDLEVTDITNENPLSSFNHTSANKKEAMFKFVETINKISENKLDISVLKQTFDKNWEDFNSAYKKILEKTKTKSDKDIPKKRNEKEVLNDILDTVRFTKNKITVLETFYKQHHRIMSPPYPIPNEPKLSMVADTSVIMSPPYPIPNEPPSMFPTQITKNKKRKTQKNT
ncbi:MAG: toll/interleukin-1 receptor domain-containing protein [Endomicrobium sp.]|jgi:hypothetical protein|nr:toll/interleukin-1 receptor domain-containing protein [Endomicrobium sp.]